MGQPAKELINAMASVLSGRHIEDQDCGVIFWNGRVFVAENVNKKCIAGDGEHEFAGFWEVKDNGE